MRAVLLALSTLLALFAVSALLEEEAPARGRGRTAASLEFALKATPTQMGEPVAAPAAAQPEPPARVWSLLVLDGQDRPIRRAPVSWGSDRQANTDEEGRASLDAPENASPLTVTIFEQPYTLARSPAVVRILGTVPVEVVVVDATNGTEIQGARVALDSPSHLARGRSSTARLTVTPPEGRGFQAGFIEQRWIRQSALAGRLRVIVPVRPEKLLALRVLEPDGRPAFGAGIQRVVMGFAAPRFAAVDAEQPPELVEPVEIASEGGSLPFTAATASDTGWILLRGVPFLPGETVHVVVADPKGERFSSARFLLEEQVAPGIVTLPSEPLGESIECSTCCSWG